MEVYGNASFWVTITQSHFKIDLMPSANTKQTLISDLSKLIIDTVLYIFYMRLSLLFIEFG
jgi:hypothetical protein